ncbi:hypothetical protein HNQ40_003380 [Algisphaera agarilytica]|uniref:Uncharacterized protein n=1 Tax=Algisphaera agarilytica TaxID=1385975 RepID=A0A7X0HBV8_9BACT|nr:hypothetical protein [Algisphaera agarilytica]
MIPTKMPEKQVNTPYMERDTRRLQRNMRSTERETLRLRKKTARKERDTPRTEMNMELMERETERLEGETAHMLMITSRSRTTKDAISRLNTKARRIGSSGRDQMRETCPNPDDHRAHQYPSEG